MRSIFDEKISDIHTHIPAQVVSYDPALNLVSIQPCIMRLRIDDPNNITTVRLPQIDDVPVHQFGSGKCLLSIAPQVDSYGSFHVCERSISKWINEGGIVGPGRASKFDISDGFFMPGMYPIIEDGDNGLLSIDGISDDRIELRTRSHDSFVAVTDDEYVKITAENEIILNDGSDYAVCFNKLKTAFNKLKLDFNTLVSYYNSHVHTGVTSGVANTGTTVSVGQSSTADIEPSKVATIRVPTGAAT